LKLPAAGGPVPRQRVPLADKAGGGLKQPERDRDPGDRGFPSPTKRGVD